MRRSTRPISTRLGPRRLVAAGAAALLLTACGGSGDSESTTADTAADAEVAASTGVRVVSPDEAAAIQEDPPPGLVILDVRTADEFAAGHLEGATTLDFYAEDFGARLAELDRDVPYLLYCQSGNRSGQTREMMVDLGFSDVADIDGGIAAWTADGYAVVPA